MILLVEDEDVRHEWFRRHLQMEDLHLTKDVDEAIFWLGLDHHHFESLWLDHDLGTEPKVGRDVATWLIRHPSKQPDLHVYVHSVNVVSGPKIVQELIQAGRPATLIPFTRLKSMLP